MFKAQGLFVALAITLLVLASGVAEARKMYRWTDANGNPVVSDRPPPQGTPFTEIDVAFTPARRREALRDTPTTNPVTEPVPVMGDSKVPELCTRALDHIEKLETAPTIAVADGAGNVRVLSEEERAEQLENARRMAAQHCPES